MHLWQVFMLKHNKQSNGKKGITQIKASACNILTVTNENECGDPLLIKDKMVVKPKKNRTKRYTQLLKLLPSCILLQYASIEFIYNLIMRGFLANTTPVYFSFFTSDLVVVLSLDESIAIFHPHRRRTQPLIFLIISLTPFVGNVDHLSHFPN